MWKFIKRLLGLDYDSQKPIEIIAVPSLDHSTTWPFPSVPQRDERDLNNDGVVDPTEKTIAKHRTSPDKRKKRKFVKREPEVVATQAPATAKKKGIPPPPPPPKPMPNSKDKKKK